jgi:hypothetical protein
MEDDGKRAQAMVPNATRLYHPTRDLQAYQGFYRIPHNYLNRILEIYSDAHFQKFGNLMIEAVVIRKSDSKK